MARVALTFNLIRAEMLRDKPLDAIAELDNETTIGAVEAALEEGGHQVMRIEADEDAFEQLRAAQPDIVFNIAEGIRGESREAHIPAMCELLGIPYTGSGVLTLSTCLDKARTKEVLIAQGLPTPRYQVFQTPDDPLDENLTFPAIVKLLAEGSSMGLSQTSIVDDETALRERVTYLRDTYHAPALVEKFIEGREFTVGMLKHPPEILPIAEVVFFEPRGINLFAPDDAVIPMIRQAKGADFPIPKTNHTTVCPADLDEHMTWRVQQMALRTFTALRVRDWGRMEMRLDDRANLFVLEVNPIAGIDPSYLLPKEANAAGLTYTQMINTILDSARRRYGML